MKIPGQHYCNTDEISVLYCDKDPSRRMVTKNHYLQKCPTTVQHYFGIYRKGVMIGTIQYGSPTRRQLSESISPLLEPDEVTQLHRVWVQDGFGTNIESFSIARTFRLLKETNPEIKCIVSYSSPSVGHKGGIYQALNFLFQRLGNPSSYLVSLRMCPRNRDWLHTRTINHMFGTTNFQTLRKIIGRPFLVKPDYGKYRYLYFLCKGNERRWYIESLDPQPSPYPTDVEKRDEQILVVE
jgi:hypothetical protein